MNAAGSFMDIDRVLYILGLEAEENVAKVVRFVLIPKRLPDNSNSAVVYCVVGMITWLSDIPVSYTHLRALETVLDLVFRLLLEKIKTIFV